VNRMEAFLELLRGRRSIRKFSHDPVPQEILFRIIEAASWAPSASNRQDWRFTVVTSKALKERIGEIVRSHWKSILGDSRSDAVTEALQEYTKNFDWFTHAPVLVAISAKRPEGFLHEMLGDHAEEVSGAAASASMAAQNLMLAAHAYGIGSCCITGPLAAQEALKELLGIGKRRKIVCFIALGYPAEHPEVPARKPVERIVEYIE